jgi:restriction system protein
MSRTRRGNGTGYVRFRRRGASSRGGAAARILASDWRYAAALAMICLLVAYFGLPSLVDGSPLARPVLIMAQPLFGAAGALFAVITLWRVRTGRMPASRSAARGDTQPSPGSLDGPWPLPERARAIRRAVRQLPAVQSPDAQSSCGQGSARVRPAVDPDARWRRPEGAVVHAVGDAGPDRWSLDVLQRIEWKRFEDLCREYFLAKGMPAESTPLGADGGVDVRIYSDEDVSVGRRVAAIVQCKAHSRQIGVGPVRELRGVMAHERVEKGFFMAPAGFTEEARWFAGRNRITLVDGPLFLAMLQRLGEPASTRLLQFATAGAWTIPTCPRCGAKMTLRSSARRPFWGCSSYPRCRGILLARSGWAPGAIG